MKDTALLLVVEGKKNKGDIINKYDTGRVSIPYDEEAIMCVSMWRQHAGEYSDIPIYAINVNGNPPNMACQMMLDNLGVQYIEEFHVDAQMFPCGYYNTPYGCMILEQKYVKEKYLVHIDLDMYVVKPLEKELLSLDEGCTCRIAVNEWRPTGNFPNSNFDIYPFEIATNFMYSKTEDGFYTYWWKRLENFLAQDGDQYTTEELSIFEERICDIMYFDEKYPFCFFSPRYQINHEEQINKDANFIHCHLDNNKRFQRLIKKYIKAVNNES